MLLSCAEETIPEFDVTLPDGQVVKATLVEKYSSGSVNYVDVVSGQTIVYTKENKTQTIYPKQLAYYLNGDYRRIFIESGHYIEVEITNMITTVKAQDVYYLLETLETESKLERIYFSSVQTPVDVTINGVTKTAKSYIKLDSTGAVVDAY